MSTPPVALTIAGSDPSGGAGIQADLATFAALGVHGASVVTALTAQNTTGVQGVAVTDPAFVAAQLRSVLDDLPVAVVKTGMLATEEIIDVVAAEAAASAFPRLVVDPVMVASTGARLLSEGAERAYVERLLPHATVLTPNLREAAVLLGVSEPLRTVEDLRDRAGDLQALCPDGWVVVTGGHASDETIASAGALDVVVHGGQVHELAAPWIATDNDHGTGCTFASATAARLAHGDDPLDAVRAAKTFVAGQIRRSAGWRLGHGRGPVAHTFDPPPGVG